MEEGPSATLHAASVEVALQSVPSCAVDLVVADPPYDISVGAAAWDSVVDYMSFSRTWLHAGWRCSRE